MRLSELDPRVESPSLLTLFSCTLDPGGKFKNLGFMRVSATLDPLEYSSRESYEPDFFLSFSSTAVRNHLFLLEESFCLPNDFVAIPHLPQLVLQLLHGHLAAVLLQQRQDSLFTPLPLGGLAGLGLHGSPFPSQAERPAGRGPIGFRYTVFEVFL